MNRPGPATVTPTANRRGTDLTSQRITSYGSTGHGLTIPDFPARPNAARRVVREQRKSRRSHSLRITGLVPVNGPQVLHNNALQRTKPGASVGASPLNAVLDGP
jgi:hypothetical protein